MSLEEQFDQEMLQIFPKAVKAIGYRPTRFLGMVEKQGGLATAKQLLSEGNLSDGFTRLQEGRRLDISVEALVLREPWTSLFTQQELDEAKRRLDGAGYDWRAS